MTHLIEPQIHLWTRQEYYKIAGVGLFEGKRVELIEGEVIEMSPMGSLHATCVTLTAKILERIFGPGYFIRQQMPLNAGELSEPEPDVAVIAGEVRDYKRDHPSTAVLVVEVADTSLVYDRTYKTSLYAKVGLAEYWLVNLQDNQLECFRTPITDETQPYGFGYADIAIFKPTDHIQPLGASQAKLTVAELLP